MSSFTNNQINDIVNQAYNLYTGKSEPDNIDITKLVDIGNNDASFNKSNFTKALIVVCTKNWYTDSSYRSEYNDIFYVDSEQYGGIIQSIHVEAPEVTEDSAWKSFNSGTTTIGNYTVYLPTVESKYYQKSTSWSLPITISWEQYDTAFTNENELRGFISYIMLAVDNKITMHLEEMNMMNRNNFIAEKILYDKKPDKKGVHVIDLISLYVTDRGIAETYTVETALNDKDFLAFASSTISKYLDYFSKPTSLFNVDGKIRFTPYERKACLILSEFERKIESISYANTFHDEFVKLPLHESIPWWQNCGDLSFDDISSIHVTTASGDVETSGIVAMICDKWTILHTIRKDRVASTYFDIENVTHYEYQHRDSYMNNLTMNGIIFTMTSHIE